MTVRITVEERARVRHVRLEGRLTRDEIGELDQVVGEAPAATCLELDDLRSADPAGLAALRRLRAAGVAMHGVPPHLAWRIDEGEP